MAWFLRREHVVEGPLAEEELRRRVRAGNLAPDALASPNRIDFHPLHAWKVFSPEGSLEIHDFALGDRGRSGSESRKLTTNKSTAIVGTDSPYVAGATVVRSDKGTAIMGTHGVNSPPTAYGSWPGPAQSDPDGANAPPPRTAEAALDPRPFFESIPVERPAPDDGSSKSDRANPVEPPAARILEDESPPARRAAEQRHVHVPVKPFPPIRNELAWLPLAFAASLTVIFVVTGLCVADRLLNGPAVSNISRYLPAGASVYLEIPSSKRWARGISRLEFLNDEEFDVAKWLETWAPPQDGGRGPVSHIAEHVEAIAFARVGEETLYAVEYNADSSVDASVSQFEKVSNTQWGPRYLRRPGTECVWLLEDRVEICGTGSALDTSLAVLQGRAPPAEEDAYLNAAKKRSLSSYLPLVTQPAFYSVMTPSFLAEHPFWGALSQATIKGEIDARGYFENLDLVWSEGKAPARSRDAPPTFWNQLPEGTVFYANYRASPPRNPEQFAELVGSLTSLGPGAPPVERIIEQIRGRLGFDPSALFEGLGDEGLIAFSAPPEAPFLRPEKGVPFSGALWFVQSIDDPAQVRRTVTSLIERLSEERAALTWKDEDNLVAEGPDGARIHLRFERGRLRVGIGQRTEIERVLSGGRLLRDDPAHQEALEELDPESTLVAWLDLGRMLREPELLKHENVPADFVHALTTVGPTRPVSVWGVRRFKSGHLRVRSRNFPTGLVLLAVTLANEIGALTDSLGVSIGSGAPTPTPPMGGQDTTDPEWIGPGADGAFRLPAP